MSKFDSWVMDQQERAMEEAADRLKEKEGLKTFKVSQRYIKEDVWIVNAEDELEAHHLALSVDPDTSNVLEITSTTVDYIETFDDLDKSNDSLGKEK